MAQRKVILFLVEGASDEIALGQPIAATMRNGMLSDWGKFKTDVFTVRLYPGNATFDVKGKIADTICAFVEGHVNRPVCEYELGDIAHIVHIVDTDGAFVPNARVVEGAGIEEIRYSDDRIFARNVSDIRARNNEKSQKINLMIRKSTLRWDNVEIGYSVFFMSRNLEHALMGREEALSNEKKIELAQRFRQLYSRHPEKFVELLEMVARDIPDDYSGSWDYIKQGVNSLGRHSNLILAVRQLNELEAAET